HINILCIYRSPSGNEETFINALEVFLRTYTNNLLIVGDININISKTCSKSTLANSYLDLLSSSGFLHLSDGPTRVQAVGDHILSTEIDHCFIRDNNVIAWTNKVLHWSITDHYAQLIIHHKDCVKKKDKPKSRKIINYEILDELITAHEWS